MVDKRKLLIELNENQYNTVEALARHNKLSKAEVLRIILNALDGLNEDIFLLVCTKDNIRLVRHFGQVEDMKENDQVLEFNFKCSYDKEFGAKHESQTLYMQRSGSVV